MENLAPLTAIAEGEECLLALAAYVGQVRLTDNIILVGSTE
jgi:pantoate--beta-alanine ligase